MSELDKVTKAAGSDVSRADTAKNIALIVATAQQYGITDRAQLAYILATAAHESRFRPIPEIWGPTPAQQQYEGRKDLGNTESGDGYRYRGRGFVQITGRDRYAAWSKELGIDLVKNPNEALDPEVAARILVQGMRDGGFRPVQPGAVKGGHRLDDFIREGERIDFRGARNIINAPVKSQVADTAARAEQFYNVLKTIDLQTLYSEASQRVAQTSASSSVQTQVVPVPSLQDENIATLAQNCFNGMPFAQAVEELSNEDAEFAQYVLENPRAPEELATLASAIAAQASERQATEVALEA